MNTKSVPLLLHSIIYDARQISSNFLLIKSNEFCTAIPARNGVGIDFSVPSAFLAQVTPKSIPTPHYRATCGNCWDLYRVIVTLLNNVIAIENFISGMYYASKQWEKSCQFHLRVKKRKSNNYFNRLILR